MQRNPDDAIDEIRTRADLEIELAGLMLRLRRASSHVVEGGSLQDAEDRRMALVEWFDTIADEILCRTDPPLRPYARSRIAIIAARCRALEAGAPHAAGRARTRDGAPRPGRHAH